MDWVIVIPSYNRVQTFQTKTLALLQHYNIPPSKLYLFVANEEQKRLYDEGLPSGSVGHTIVGVKGLAEVRNFIYSYFPKGHPLVWLDDDVKGLIEYDECAKRHERPLNDLVAVITKGFEECQKVGARLWGVYPSANGFFMKPTITTDLRFCVGSFWGCLNPKDDLHLKFGAEKEDYQRTIQYWDADKVVVRLNYIAPQTYCYKGKGGNQEGNRLQREHDTVNKMIDLWGQYVRRNPHRKSGFPEIRLVQPVDS